MYWAQVAAGSRLTSSAAAGAGSEVLGCVRGKGGRGDLVAAGMCFCSSMWCSHPDAVRLSWEDGEKCGCFVLSPQIGLHRAFPTLLWGTEDWD